MIVALSIFLITIGSIAFHFWSPWWWTEVASNWGGMDDTIILTFWITGFVFVAICWRYIYPPILSVMQEREKKIQETLNGWKAVVETYDALKESGEYESLIEGSQMYITDDGKGLVFRESQYEMLGLIAYSMFIGDLIPDYIQERISNTAPIDGNQKEQFDNVEVNWSIDCLLYTSPSPRDGLLYRMPSSA